MIMGDFLGKFERVRKEGNGWMAKCPAHADDKPSLYISIGDDSRILINCFAGCSAERVVEAVGLTLSDLFTEPSTKARNNGIVAAYDYFDERGALLYQVRRTHNKQFPVYHQDLQGQWKSGLNGQRRVLYRLPELVQSAADDFVFIPEGEKDVENLHRLGLVATTNLGGAGRNKWRTEYNDPLRNRHIVILPDNDDTGRSHAQMIAESLKGVAASVRVAELPGLPPKGDVSDWIAAGGTRGDLLKLVQAIAAEMPSEASQGETLLISLASVKAEHVKWLWYPYIPSGKLTMIEGDPGVGKSWLVLGLTTAVATGSGLPNAELTEPRNVMLLSAEDGLADTIRPRLDSMGANVSNIFALTGAVVFDDAGLLQVEAAIRQCAPALVIIDPMVAYLGMGVDMHKANETRVVMAALARIAERYGCAIVCVRHLSKAMGGKTIYRGIGSIDFTAACRSVLLVGADPDDKRKRAVVQIKNNLAAFGEPMGYEIRNDCFYWTGASGLTAERILSNSSEEEEKTALSEAIEFLRESLAEGDRDAKQLMTDARALGISGRTLKRAKQKLGILALQNRSIDQRAISGWRWRLLDSNDQGQASQE